MGDSPECLEGMCCHVFEALDLIQAKNHYFLYAILDLIQRMYTLFQSFFNQYNNIVSNVCLQLTRNGFNLCTEKSFKNPNFNGVKINFI